MTGDHKNPQGRDPCKPTDGDWHEVKCVDCDRPVMSEDAEPCRCVDCQIAALTEERMRLRACLEMLYSYLAHEDQDANHAWMAKQMREALHG